MFERYNIVSECDLLDAAKKLNALPAPLSLLSIATGLPRQSRDLSAKKRERDGGSGDGGHNLGTVAPKQGISRLTL